MGGQNSKPVRRIKVEPVQGYNSAGENEEERDELQTAKDTLGIVAAEQDYPEASPPDNDLQPILEESEQGETVSMVDDSDIKSRVSDKARTDALVSVQIGTSLQKSQSKRSSENSHFEKIKNDVESRHNEDLMTSSLTSPQNSILAEQHLNLINKTLEKKRDQHILTQRDTLLLERESFLYRKLTEKPNSTLTPVPRSQIRLFDSVRQLHDDCRYRKRPHRDGGEVTANEAAEMHKDHRAKTFKSVVDDLTSGFKSDAVKVKAILAWICKQNIGRIDFGQKHFDPDTPNGYMQLMQEGKGTYQGFFALLCRAANIKCAIIPGISKGASYEVGNPNTDRLQNAWNAVFINDGWRLVHPLWVCKSLAGRRQGGWMTIESQGNFRNDVSGRNDGEVTNTYNDYFIFTKPEEFIYRHLPDDPKWQLLPVPISMDSFLTRSYCRPAFFINDFKILSDDQCEFASEKGEPIKIVIGYPDTIASELVFGYELGLKLPENLEVKKSLADYHQNYERFMFVSKAKDRVSFEIRFAQTGVYKLRLFGGLYSEYGNKPPWIMDVKLVCSELPPKPVPLPFDPGIVGWGHGPVAENLGLFVPSHESSTIEIAFDGAIVIQFILKQRLVFNVTLRHSEIRPSVLEEYLSFEILDEMETLELRISLSCPDSGEYCLEIDVCSEDKQENACNYLVQTGKEKRRETYYQRKARKLLTEAMMTNDESLLTHALKRCEESSLPVNDPEVNAGEKRLEYLHCKEGLKTALMVNRIDKSEEALHRVQQANLDRLFEKEIRRVKHHLKQLLSLDKDGWNSLIPEIDRISLMELAQLRQPKQPVKYVVMAMYMLLGAPQDLMTDWSQIKALLRNKDTTLVEMARLENYLDMDSVEITSPDDTTMELVEEILQTYSEDDVRRIDNTAAAYYIWVRMMHSKLKHRLKSRRASIGRFGDDFGGRSSIVSVPDRSQSKSVMGVRRHHSYKPSLTQESVYDVYTSASVKREKNSNVFRSTSVKHEKDADVFRSTSVKHEKDDNVSRSTSLKHEKDANVFRSTSVKHEKLSDVFRRPSVKYAKISDATGSLSLTHETTSDVSRSPSVKYEKDSNVLRRASVKHVRDSNVLKSPSITHRKVFDVFNSQSFKSKVDGRETHVEAKHGKGKPNNIGSPRTSQRAVRSGGRHIKPSKIEPKTDNVTSGKVGSPRPKRKNIPTQFSAVNISRKQPVSATLDDGNDNLSTYSSNITAYRQVNDRDMSVVQNPSVEVVNRKETPSWLGDSLIDKRYSIPRSNLNSGKNPSAFFRVATKESIARKNRTYTRPNHNGQALSSISKGNDSINHLRGKFSFDSEKAMQDLQKRDKRKVENVSGIVNGSLQASDQVQRSGKTLKVSPGQQKPVIPAVSQTINSNKASLNGTNTVPNGRLRTAIIRGNKVPNTKPLSTSGNIKGNAKHELEKPAVESSSNGISKNQTFVKNKLSHAL